MIWILSTTVASLHYCTQPNISTLSYKRKLRYSKKIYVKYRDTWTKAIN